MARKPLIGIMVPSREKRIWYLEQYLPFNKLNVTLCSFTPGDVDWKSKRLRGLQYKSGKWQESHFSIPDAIYNRCYNKQKMAQHLERNIGKNKCFNLVNHFNKWEIYKILAGTRLKHYVPETYLNDRVRVLDLLDIHTPLFLKPIYGHFGEGVYRVQIMEDGKKRIDQDHMNSRLIFEDDRDFREKIQELVGGEKYIVQKAIALTTFNNQYFDIRVLIQKNLKGKWKMTGMISRIAYHHFFNTSVSQKIIPSHEVLNQCFEPEKADSILSTLEDVSIAAAARIEKRIHPLGEMSVDFGLDEDGKPWMIEVNGIPQKSTFKKGISKIESGDLVYKRPLQYAYYLSKN